MCRPVIAVLLTALLCCGPPECAAARNQQLNYRPVIGKSLPRRTLMLLSGEAVRGCEREGIGYSSNYVILIEKVLENVQVIGTALKQ